MRIPERDEAVELRAVLQDAEHNGEGEPQPLAFFEARDSFR